MYNPHETLNTRTNFHEKVVFIESWVYLSIG